MSLMQSKRSGKPPKLIPLARAAEMLDLDESTVRKGGAGTAHLTKVRHGQAPAHKPPTRGGRGPHQLARRIRALEEPGARRSIKETGRPAQSPNGRGGPTD